MTDELAAIEARQEGALAVIDAALTAMDETAHPDGAVFIADRLRQAGWRIAHVDDLAALHAEQEARARGLDAAITFLRKRLVGVPPNVDGEDMWFASLLDEAEAKGRTALAPDASEGEPTDG
jgi:hypothetical protein